MRYGFTGVRHEDSQRVEATAIVLRSFHQEPDPRWAVRRGTELAERTNLEPGRSALVEAFVAGRLTRLTPVAHRGEYARVERGNR